MNKKLNRKNYHFYVNFITVNYLTIYTKSGRLLGSLSQHLFINLTHGSGVFFGIWGLNYLFKTSYETFVPDMFLYGGYLEAISHIIIEKLNTSAFSVYGLLPMTSGAIHW